MIKSILVFEMLMNAYEYAYYNLMSFQNAYLLVSLKMRMHI